MSKCFCCIKNRLYFGDRYLKILSLLVFLFFIFANTNQVLAASVTWDRNAATAGQYDGAGVWLNTNQWWNGSTNVDWTSGDDAIFGWGGAGGNVTLANPTIVNSLTVNSFTAVYNLGSAANAITLNNGITKNSGGTEARIISPLILANPQTWLNNSSGLLTISSTTDNGGNILLVDGTGPVAINGIVSGSGGITANGTRLVVGGGTPPVHTYTGTTTINSGVLMQASNNLGPGNLTINNGVIESYWSTHFTRTLGSGVGQIQILGGESGFSLNGSTGMNVTLNNNATYEVVWGSTYFNPSTLVLQSTYAQNSSTLNFQNKIDLNGNTRTILVNPTTGTGAGLATISGIIRNSNGTFGINKTGLGKLNLTANNTYNGTTTISTGTLSLSNANNNNIASSSIINIESGATLNTTGLAGVNDLILANGQTLMGDGTVVGSTTISSGSSISPGTSPGTINHTGNVTYTGGGNYIWEINDTTGVVGTNWDLQNITGALSITATSSNKFNLNINSLTAGNVSGNVPNFDKYSNYTWTITSASSGVSGFATSSFNLDTNNFMNDISGSVSNGYFDIQLSGNDLQLTYTGAVDTTYTLNYISGSNGTLTGSTTQTVTYGTDGTEVTAIPDTGYHFVNWSDGATSTSRTDLNVIADISVTANFEINTYTFNYSAGSNGTLTGSTTQNVNYGADGSEVTAVPNTGHHFISWNDGVLTPARIDTNATSSITVTANFDSDIYTLSYTAGSHGSLTGSTTQSVEYNFDGTTVTAIPDLNYYFVDWSDGVTTNPRVDLNINSNISVTANFEINQYTLTFDSDGGTTVDTIIDDFGTTITPPANPTRGGYTFIGWSPTLPINMPASNTSYTALWDQNQIARKSGTSLASRIMNLENMGNQQEAQRLKEQYNVVQPTITNTNKVSDINSLITLLIQLNIIKSEDMEKVQLVLDILRN